MRLLRLLAFLASLLLLSPLYCMLSECSYRIDIEGCESGSIALKQPQILGSALRPLSRIVAKECCAFVGNLMENHADTFHVNGPAGEWRVVMGQDDGPHNYIEAQLHIPAARDEHSFTLSVKELPTTPGDAPRATSIRVYRAEDYHRAYPPAVPQGLVVLSAETPAEDDHPSYPLGSGQTGVPQAPLQALAEVSGNSPGRVLLPFGAYIIEECRTTRNEYDSPCSIYYLTVIPRP